MDTTLRTAHDVSITRLKRRTTYRYTVHSADAAGNSSVVSEPFELRTAK